MKTTPQQPALRRVSALETQDQIYCLTDTLPTGNIINDIVSHLLDNPAHLSDQHHEHLIPGAYFKTVTMLDPGEPDSHPALVDTTNPTSTRQADGSKCTPASS